MPKAAPRVVIVHTAEHVRAALEAASSVHVPIILQSAPNAVAYAGALYLFNMFAQAKSSFPKTDATLILDCGEMGAEAVAAMQMGHTHIRSTAPDELRAKLADIAQQLGIVLVTDSFSSLDLAQSHDAKAACKKWLVES